MLKNIPLLLISNNFLKERQFPPIFNIYIYRMKSTRRVNNNTSAQLNNGTNISSVKRRSIQECGMAEYHSIFHHIPHSIYLAIFSLLTHITRILAHFSPFWQFVSSFWAWFGQKKYIMCFEKDFWCTFDSKAILRLKVIWGR